MKKILRSRGIKLAAALCLLLCLSLSLLPVQAFAANYYPSGWKKGESNSESFNMGGTIESCTKLSGSLPGGVSQSVDGEKIKFSGTPNESGSFTVTYEIELAGSSMETSFVFDVADAGSDEEDSGDGAVVTTPAPVVTKKPVTGKPIITKHPTGEYVEEGGTAVFVARADGADSFSWRIVSNDASNTVLAKDAANYFKGLKVSGTNSEWLELTNIPASLNGWYIECKFDNKYGSSFSNGAKVTVAGVTTMTGLDGGNTNTPNVPTAEAPTVPTISGQPRGANLNAGQTTVLSVSAAVSDGGTVKYQWYSNSVNSTAGGEAVSGATNSQYQPPQKEGATYYYCAVWNSKDNMSSTVVYSTPVEVNYIIQAGAAPVATNPPSGNTNVVVPSGGSNNSSNNSGNNGPTVHTIITPSVEQITSEGDKAAPQDPNGAQDPANAQQSTQAEQTVQARENKGSLATTLLIVLGVLAVGLIAAIVFIFLKNGRAV